MISLFDADTVSSNETAFVNLDVGKHPYVITAAKISMKDDPVTQKKVPNGLQVQFKREDTGTTHSHFYAICAPGDRGRIAKGDSKALWDATKLGGAHGPDRLPNYVGKRVTINAEMSLPDQNGRTFINIRGTWATADLEKGATPAASPVLNSPDDQIPGVGSPSEQAAPVQAPAPRATWKRATQTA